MTIKRWLNWARRPRLFKEMQDLIMRYAEMGKFSGTVLVAQGNDVVLTMASGLADRSANLPNTPNTIFRIGSMTKPFTAIAIMQLVERGQISLDDRLSRHMPDFPNSDLITIAHLLSNTSGLSDYVLLPEYQGVSSQSVSPQDLVDLFRDKPLLSAPGKRLAYSNSGWVLLGMVAEQVSGRNYGDLIRERILVPAAMANSGYAWEALPSANRAAGYDEPTGETQQAQSIHSSTMYAAGGLYSTSEDLFRWRMALEAGTLLRHETLLQMVHPVTPEYGLGWELGSLHGRAYISHSGGLPGFVSNFVCFPHENVSIIVLSNLGSAAISQVVEGLAAILFGTPYQMPSSYSFITLDPKSLQDFVGDYAVTYYGRTSNLKFRLQGDALVMNVMGLPSATLNAISDNTFYARSKGEIVMTFLRDENRRVDRIQMQWAGSDVVATRKQEEN